MSHTTPQQRSDLARKAAQARWSRMKSSPIEYDGGGQGGGQGKGSSLTTNKLTANNWLSTRFCLRLEQDPTGAWLLLTPAGLRLPASPAEVSLWLDLLALKSAQSVPTIR